VTSRPAAKCPPRPTNDSGMFASLLQHVAQLLCPPPRHTGYRQAERWVRRWNEHETLYHESECMPTTAHAQAHAHRCCHRTLPSRTHTHTHSCFTADELDAMRTQYCLHVLNK
jgi:hypothetical protein